MTRKTVCALSVLVFAVLLLVSCGQSTPTSTTAPAVTQTTTAPATGAKPVVTGAAIETPKYGGVVNIALGADILNFDEVIGFHPGALTLHITNDELLWGDWSKGSAGTKQTDWAVRGIDRFDLKTGCLAESWEMPEVGTLIYHIRKGIHWALNPNSEYSRLVNGREFTSDDVVFTLNMYCTNPRSWFSRQYPRLVKDPSLSITAPDKWTVLVKTSRDTFQDARTLFSDFASIVPPEVVNKYGDMSDWRKSVGTGAFMLTDFVSGSSATLVRNPNYWGTDPIGPGKGNKLPYLDGVKYVIIPDASTRFAGLRTAKIDTVTAVEWEDAASLRKTTPELLYLKWTSDGANGIFMRIDKQDLPFKDLRVRRALMMATDFEAIKKDFFGGDAQILTWPIPYLKEYGGAYLSLEEAPASVKELYVYSPEKAKALLAEAGYPNGFKTKMTCQASPTTYVDYFSIIKTMWAKVGIDLTIDPKETAVFSSLYQARAYDEMICMSQGPIGAVYKFLYCTGNSFTNGSYISDPKAEAAWTEVQKYVFTDIAAADRVHKEWVKYPLDQVWAIPYEYAPMHHFWWPWLKNYHGEYSIGYDTEYKWTTWAWVDQDMKEKATGRR